MVDGLQRRGLSLRLGTLGILTEREYSRSNKIPRVPNLKDKPRLWKPTTIRSTSQVAMDQIISSATTIDHNMNGNFITRPAALHKDPNFHIPPRVSQIPVINRGGLAVHPPKISSKSDRQKWKLWYGKISFPRHFQCQPFMGTQISTYLPWRTRALKLL